MSHYFSIDEIKSKLVVVSALALSGEEFCKRYKMGSKEHHNTYSIEEYTKLTKILVSNILIEIAVKLRSSVDTLKKNDDQIRINKDISAYGAGRNESSENAEKDFRFICNKIIHAEGFNLNFVGKKSLHKDMVWWSGDVTVSGSYQKEEWKFFFSVLEWADQIKLFLEEAESRIESSQNNSRDLLSHS